jgi:hypothetical protein
MTLPVSASPQILSRAWRKRLVLWPLHWVVRILFLFCSINGFYINRREILLKKRGKP